MQNFRKGFSVGNLKTRQSYKVYFLVQIGETVFSKFKNSLSVSIELRADADESWVAESMKRLSM